MSTFSLFLLYIVSHVRLSYVTKGLTYLLAYFVDILGELKHHLQVCSAKYLFTTPSLASQAMQIAKPLNAQVFNINADKVQDILILLWKPNNLDPEHFGPTKFVPKCPTYTYNS